MAIDTRQVQQAMTPSSGGANNAPNTRKKKEDFGLSPGVPVKPASNPTSRMPTQTAAFTPPQAPKTIGHTQHTGPQIQQTQAPQPTSAPAPQYAQYTGPLMQTQAPQPTSAPAPQYAQYTGPLMQTQAPQPQQPQQPQQAGTVPVKSDKTVGTTPNNVGMAGPPIAEDFGLNNGQYQPGDNRLPRTDPWYGGQNGQPGGGNSSRSYSYSVTTPTINAPEDNSRIRGALESSVLNYLDNPNRYDNDLIRDGMNTIRERMDRVRRDTMQGARGDAARSGMLTSTIGNQQLGDVRQQLAEQENAENFAWGKTIADAFASDRNASLQAATNARAQELQKYGIDSQRALAQAQLEMQSQQLQIESDLRDRALELQRQGMDEGNARFQAEMEFNERWNQRNYDLDMLRLYGLEGAGMDMGGGAPDPVGTTPIGGGTNTAQPRPTASDFGLGGGDVVDYNRERNNIEDRFNFGFGDDEDYGLQVRMSNGRGVYT